MHQDITFSAFDFKLLLVGKQTDLGLDPLDEPEPTQENDVNEHSHRNILYLFLSENLFM